MLQQALGLVANGQAPRNTKTGDRTNPKLQETLVPQRLLVAIPAGFEPATHGVEIRYSIQLSYGTVCQALARSF